MIKFLIAGASAFVLYIILDLVWFKFAGHILKEEIGSIARVDAEGDWQVRTWAAVLVYALMAGGLILFVIRDATSWGSAILFSALFGAITFGIYDLTNMAILSAWTLRFLAIDITWGIVANALVGSASYFMTKIV